MTNHSGPGSRTVTAAAMAVAMVAVPAVLTTAAMVAVMSLAMPIAAMDLAMTKAMATDANQVNLVILHGGPGDNRAQQNLKQDVDVEVVAEENSLLDIEIAEPEEEE